MSSKKYVSPDHNHRFLVSLKISNKIDKYNTIIIKDNKAKELKKYLDVCDGLFIIEIGTKSGKPSWQIFRVKH